MDIRRTCHACPEQYDVISETYTLIGYIRLRHGHFKVCHESPSDILFERYFPLTGNETNLRDGERLLLNNNIDTDSDGIFISNLVRGVYLDIAEEVLTPYDEYDDYSWLDRYVRE